MVENSETKPISTIDQAEDRFQDYDKEHEFNTAGVKFDRKYKPRTAALPQQNSAFQ